MKLRKRKSGDSIELRPLPAMGIENAPMQRRRSVLSFFLADWKILTALSFGCVLAIACFVFTFWLSEQIFMCPTWAVNCTIRPSTSFIVARLGLVQGVVNTVFGIGTSLMAFAVYQITETTTWPTLAKQTASLRQVDQYIATCRGSLVSSPFAIVHSVSRKNGFLPLTTLSVATAVALLLNVNSVIVGHAYTVQQVNTTYFSQTHAGGGAGFGFFQSSPPGPQPAAIGGAYPLYASWAYGISQEPMPQYRDYIVDRSNLSQIGTFTVNAIQVVKNINCSGMPIHINGGNIDEIISVDTNTGDGSVDLRVQPELTLWVDSQNITGSSASVTRIFFAAFNGSIEGGHNTTSSYLREQGILSVSTLACDLAVTLRDSQLCVGLCQSNNNVTVSSLELMSRNTSVKHTTSWFEAVVTTYGFSALGTQPMLTSKSDDTLNSSLGLLVGYSTDGEGGTSRFFSQRQLTDFIDIGTGALAIVMPREWSGGFATVTSYIDTDRLSTPRVYILLLPPLVVLALVVAQLIVSAAMQSSAGVKVARLASLLEVVYNSQTSDIREAVEKARTSGVDLRELGDLTVRYGYFAGGTEGIGSPEHIQPLPRIQRGYESL